MNTINTCRFNELNCLMESNRLDAILILTPGMGNLDLWLFGEDKVPTPAPFNRNSAFLIFKGCDVAIRLCQTATHPTDRMQYSHFEDAEIEEQLSGSSVGVVHPETMKLNVRNYLSSIQPEITLKDITAAFEEVKALKTAEDIRRLKKAAKEYDKLFSAMSLILRPGRLESEVVNEIRQRASWQGAESETPGFHTMVWLTSAPEGEPSIAEPLRWPGRRLEEHDRVNITVKGYIGGTAAVLSRSYILGEPSEKSREYWDIAVKAQQLTASLAVPGAKLKDITVKVNEFLENHGSAADTSGWIHGIGTSVYEAPRNVGTTESMVLKEGMVLCLEPAFWDGITDPYRCSDGFVIDMDGAKKISTLPQTLFTM